MDKCRFGVYLPGDICSELYGLLGESGQPNRSKVFQEALQLYISENKWRLVDANVVGAVLIVYDHERGHVDEELTDIQHDYLDVIVSSLHVHLDKLTCLQILVVKGNSKRLGALIESLEGLRGVRLVRSMIISAEHGRYTTQSDRA